MKKIREPKTKYTMPIESLTVKQIERLYEEREMCKPLTSKQEIREQSIEHTILCTLDNCFYWEGLYEQAQQEDWLTFKLATAEYQNYVAYLVYGN